LLGIAEEAFIAETQSLEKRPSVNRENGEPCMMEAYSRGGINPVAEAVCHWAGGFKPGAEILEIGFGLAAVPQLLIDAGLRLHLVEPSLSRLIRFQQLFPEVPSECLLEKRCMFFSRTFDGVIVCGTTPSLPQPSQIALLARIEPVLRAGGRLMVIFPPAPSRQTGANLHANETYETILWNLGLEVQPELVDRSGDRYVCAVKHVQAGVPS
jgi:hypothetical protein